MIDRSRNSNIPIQDILISTRKFAHKIWKLLSDQDKLIFKNIYSSTWAVWRHPIPLFIFKEIGEYFESGFIDVIKSTSLQYKNGYIELSDGHTGKTVSVKYLVDGTGGTTDIIKSKNILLQNLRKREMIYPTPCGGIRTDSLNFRVINKKIL